MNDDFSRTWAGLREPSAWTRALMTCAMSIVPVGCTACGQWSELLQAKKKIQTLKKKSKIDSAIAE